MAVDRTPILPHQSTDLSIGLRTRKAQIPKIHGNNRSETMNEEPDRTKFMKYDIPESLKWRLGIKEEPHCLYCSAAPDTTEHVLPAAFGSSKNAPILQDRLCPDCNNKRLGLLDQQLARCGMGGPFAQIYGILGRKDHDPVNPFVQGKRRRQTHRSNDFR